MKRWTLPLLAALLFAITACIPQAARPQPPQVQLLAFGLVSLDPFSGRAEFNVNLRLTNPNGFGLPLLDSTLTAELGGVQFRMGIPAVDIPSGQSRDVQTRLSVPVADATRALASLVGGQATRFRLLGELNVTLLGARTTVGPATLLDRDVQISLNFSLPQLRITAVRLDGLALVFSLQAVNSNIIGFALQGPMRVSIGGREVGQAGLNLNLAPGQTSQGEFRVQLTGLPGFGGVSIQTDFRALIPGIFDRPVVSVLEGALR
ncbi:MAG: LEA type 2 family protein [Meiothermus sp.]|nr:LEA type 2 family protein [Meiothermus sp.]